MEAVWFAIVSAMLAVYAVLDGFDFGVGVVHRLVARTDEERRTVLAAIGPVWDGNEVWLIAAGGVLFMSFPKVYATAFSGFYMALMMVLWLLILRGVAIEFRSHQDHPLWREFWDTVFSLASVLLAMVFGTTIGNLVRGVPLGEDGLRGMPLFTNFRPGREPGILAGTRASSAFSLWSRWLATARPLPRLEDDRTRPGAQPGLRPNGMESRDRVVDRRDCRYCMGATHRLLQPRRPPMGPRLRRTVGRRDLWGVSIPATRPGARGVSILVRVSARDGGNGAGRKLPVLAAVDPGSLVQSHRRQHRFGPVRDGRGAGLVGRRDRPDHRLPHLPVPHDSGKGRGGPGGGLLSRPSPA